jgi:GNAT superfamily N-acetyltransferase
VHPLGDPGAVGQPLLEPQHSGLRVIGAHELRVLVVSGEGGISILGRRSVTIRVGGEDDYAGCIAVMELLPDSFTSSGIEACKRDLPRSHVLIADDDSKLDGFAAWESRGESRAELAWLAVRPDAQGKGIGARLAREAEADATRAGASEMEVKTLAEGEESPEYELTRRFYDKLGYELAEVIDPYPGWEPGNPCAIYRKSLHATA